MPIIVTTHLKAPPEVIESLLSFDPESKQEFVDFNKVIPMPKDIYNGDTVSKEDEEKYGDKTWLVWRPENWGTKWPAFETERMSDTSIYFDTAWNAPWPVIDALAKRFPKAEISIRTASDSGVYGPENRECIYFGDSETVNTAPPIHDPKGKRWSNKVTNRKFA